jgi:nucleoside-diphosphate-sugar epimerase
MERSLHVVFGTGPLGRSVMDAALLKGYKVRMVNRTGRAAVPDAVEVMRADVLSGENVRQAAEGAAVIYQCTNPPYDQWPALFPRMQRNILDTAAAVGASLVIGENVYMYGDTNGKPFTEDLPNAAETRKGRARAAMAEEALKAHNEGRVRVVIGRASDYFGPEVFASAMGERAFLPAVQGKAASLLGNIDLPHTFSYIRDVGTALVTLSGSEDAFGQIWHTPNAETVSQREFMRLVSEETGRPVKLRVAGKTMMQLAGLFVPTAKEIVEMMYEFDKPFIVDSAKYERKFGTSATPLSSAIRETVKWYRNHIEQTAG